MAFINTGRHVSSSSTSWNYRGSISGFSLGGANHYGGGGTGVWYFYADILSHSFTTDGDAVDSTGNLQSARHALVGFSSETHSFAAGGNGVNIIESFSNTNPAAGSTDLADLTAVYGGTPVSGLTHGYHIRAAGVNGIDKFAFANTVNAVGVGNLLFNHGNSRYMGSTDSNANYGYVAGAAAPNNTAIERFSFDNESITNDVGDCTVGDGETAGCSSETHGYAMGNGVGVTNIDKYIFASSANAVDVGDLPHNANLWSSVQTGGGRGNGMSSTTHGYVAGGELYTSIDKFAFANESTQARVGEIGGGLTTLRAHHGSSHY
tara:strand:+ start:12945 stop:13904 length:960 start_codon:yes stop_codon:yes gene_type:complete